MLKKLNNVSKHCHIGLSDNDFDWSLVYSYAPDFRLVNSYVTDCWLVYLLRYWLLIGLFITLLMVDWFIYYTTYGWLVYLLRYWLTIGFQDLERVEERHLFMSRVKKKKITTLLEQNYRILLHLFICGNFEHNFIFICFKNNQGLFSYFRLDHESVV